MKSKLLSLSLFSLSAVSPFLVPSFTPSAMAGCSAVDVGVQVAIEGSRRPSGRQSNRANQQFGENCNGSGANATSVGTQVCVSGRCDQRRNSDQFVDGNGRRTNVKTPNIPVKVHVPVRVYSPAQDPNFMNKLHNR